MVDSKVDEDYHQSPDGRARQRLLTPTPQGHSPSQPRFSLQDRRESHTPSTVSVSSNSPTSPNAKSPQAALNQFHIRTKAGNVRSSVSQHNLDSPNRPIPPPKTRREARVDDDEMPFDQMGLSRPIPRYSPRRYLASNPNRLNLPPPLHRPFDEPSAFLDENAPEDELIVVGTGASSDRCVSDHSNAGRRDVQVLRAYLSDDDRYRCASPPSVSRKVSQSSLLQFPNRKHPISPPSSLAESDATTRFMSNSRELTTDELPFLPTPTDETRQIYEEFGLSPGSSTESASKKARRKLAWTKLKPSGVPAGTADDDSLFQFDDDQRRNPQVADVVLDARAALATDFRKPRRLRRTWKSEDENSSVEGEYTLQKRTKQAYDRRNRHLQKGVTARPPRQTKPLSMDNIICFDASEEFTMSSDRHKTSRADTESRDVTTVASGMSVNSEYTKSMESEVEDLFKDLLLLGNGRMSRPGRRSYRYREAKKQDLERISQDEESFATETQGTIEETEEWTVDASKANETLSTTNGGNISSSQASTASPEKKSVTTTVATAEDDPLRLVWDLLEGGVNLVTDVLGIIPPTSGCAPPKCDPADQDVLPDSDLDYALYSHPGINAFVTSAPMITSDVKKEEENVSSPDASILLASEWMLAESVVDNETSSYDAQHLESPRFSVQRDPRIEDLALCTARFVHMLRGIPFQKSDETSILSKVQFKVVKLGLPLGVLFQENDGGCWVANILPTGNAVKLPPEDVILVGDQLAAVDGRSAIEVKVDDICTLISEAENTQSIELTFLRYVGPLTDGKESTGAVEETPDGIVEELSPKESPMEDGMLKSPLEEHVFDTMHKMLPISKNEEKKNLKKKREKKRVSPTGKAMLQWFGRHRKLALNTK